VPHVREHARHVAHDGRIAAPRRREIARRFKWTSTNPLENVHSLRHTYKVKAFTPQQIATLLEVADAESGLIVRTLASTGMRFGELAGLRWSQVDLDKGIIRLCEQYTHGA
jgi:integrase